MKDTDIDEQIPAELQDFIRQGAKEYRAAFNPQLRLANKEGNPGAFLLGTFKGIRDQKYEKNGEEKMGHIASFILKKTNVPVQKNDNGLFTDIPLTKAFGKSVDVWVDGLLLHQLKNMAVNVPVGVLYTGKKVVGGYAQPLNQFKVWTTGIPDEEVPF